MAVVGSEPEFLGCLATLLCLKEGKNFELKQLFEGTWSWVPSSNHLRTQSCQSEEPASGLGSTHSLGDARPTHPAVPAAFWWGFNVLLFPPTPSASFISTQISPRKNIIGI